MPALYAILSLFLFAQASLSQNLLEVWPLQFHCGQQPLKIHGALAYGLLVYQESSYENGAEPEVVFFRAESLGTMHPFCREISTAMKEGRNLVLTFSAARELTGVVVGLNSAQKR